MTQNPTSTNQGKLQAWLRSQTGSNSDFNGDMLIYLKSLGYDTTLGYNGCLLKFLKTELGFTNQEVSLNDMMALYAEYQGKVDWSGVVNLVTGSFNILLETGDHILTEDNNKIRKE